MSNPRAHALCANVSCGKPFAAHTGVACPNGRTRFRHTKGAGRVSTSFTVAEVDAINDLLAILRRGGDTRIAARLHSKSLGRLAHKVATMKSRIAARGVRDLEAAE